MSEEATAELENTETTEGLEKTSPSMEAESTSEKVASPADEKTETEKEEIDSNQYHALKRKVAKQAKEARELKKKEAELQAKLAEATNAPPDPNKYDTQDEYVEALAEHKAKLKTPVQAYDPTGDFLTEVKEDGQRKYKDYDQVAFATKEMLTVLEDFDNPADITYYLGQNKAEAQRLLNATPMQLAREFGKIEAKLAKPVPRVSKAPDPVTPIDDASTLTPDVSKMSMAEYAEFRNKQRWKQGKI